MANRIQAVYEKGVFRPMGPVPLPDGAIAQVVFESASELEPPQALAAALAEIARMPAQSPNDGFSGADHDDVLYGPKGAR